jgi:HK97 family phage portal protein
MGLLDLFRSSPARARTEPTLSASSDVQSESQWKSHGLVMSGAGSRAGVLVSETTALSLPAVMQALRVLCGVFAMTPLHYYRETAVGRERAKDDPLYRLFHRQPNRHQSAFGLKEIMLADILLAGNFYAYVSRDARQRVVALTRLNPLTVTVNEYFDRATGIELFYDAMLPDKSAERFAARDIWHVSGLSRNGLYGLNPIRYMRDALGATIATADYAASFWGNDARPGTILTTKAKMPQEAKEALRADWKRRFGGPTRAGEIAVLDQELEPKFLSTDNQKSQFVETRTFQVLEVARAWGVPPHLLFELSRATFGNIEQQSLEFVIYHLGPHYERVASAANLAFAAEDGFFEFLPDALVKGDIKSRWEAYTAARNSGVLNADEIRERENLNRIGGPAGEERWRPANMTIAGTPVAPPEPARVAPAAP